MKDKDYVLIIWIIASFIFDTFLIVGASYVVFWKGYSGWWFALAILLGIQPTLFKALRKRYNIKED